MIGSAPVEEDPMLALFGLISHILVAPASAGQQGYWDLVPVDTREDVLRDIVLDPSNPQLWAGRVADRTGRSFHISLDGGETWRSVEAPRGVSVSGLAFDPAVPGRLFAGGPGSASYSDDLGFSWTTTPDRELHRVDGHWTVVDRGVLQPPAGYRALVRDPGVPGLQYAATREGVFVTEDGGETWQPRVAWLEDKNVIDLALDPAQPQHLVALTERAVFRSNNGGRVWKRETGEGPSGFFVYQKLLGPPGQDLFIGGSQRALWVVSEDGAERRKAGCDAWSMVKDGPATATASLACAWPGRLAIGSVTQPKAHPVQTGLTNARVDRLRLFDDDGTIAALVDGGHVAMTRDLATWAALHDGSGSGPGDVARDPGGSGVVLVANSRGLLARRSSDEGWEQRIKTGVATVRFDPFRPGRAWAGGTSGEVWRSDDLGWSWTQVGKLPIRDRVWDLAFAAGGGDSVFALVRNHGLFRLTDQDTWMPVGSPKTTGAGRRLAVDPIRPGVLWLAAQSHGLLKSGDGGQSWTLVDTDCKLVNDVVIDQLEGSHLAVGCETGRLVRSTNGGDSWAGVSVELEGDVTALVFDEQSPPSLTAGTHIAEVVAVAPDGAVATNDRFANMPVDLLAFSGDGQTGYQYGPEGLFRTSDGGETWSGAGFTGKKLTGLALSPNGRQAWAWERGEGLHRYDGERWRSAGTPSYRIEGSNRSCTLRPESNSRFYLGASNTGLLVVEVAEFGVREWYSRDGNRWTARGAAVFCKSGENIVADILPPSRSEDQADLARRMGVSVERRTIRLVRKATGLEVGAAHALSSDKDLLFTREGKVVEWASEKAAVVGQLPPGQRAVFVSPYSASAIYIGTSSGILVSHDRGRTFEAL